MKNFMKVMVITTLFLVSTVFYNGTVNAAVLTFDSSGSLGVTLGGQMTWNGTGGGHLYEELWDTNDYIYFSAPTTVNSFQMNAMPWENFGGGYIGFADIAAYDASNLLLWSTTVDLRNYTAWSDWLNVTVNTNNVSSLEFFAPGNAPHSNGFWPSIDNMVIDNPTNGVPEPTTMFLLGLGLMGIAGVRRKFNN